MRGELAEVVPAEKGVEGHDYYWRLPDRIITNIILLEVLLKPGRPLFFWRYS
jgi:hypothetical protein